MRANRFIRLFALLMTVLIGTARGSGIRLLSRVVVPGDEIKLSDLLPPAVSDELRAAALNVGMGRSPQLGSVRMLTASEVLARLRTTAFAGENFVTPDTVVVERECAPFDQAQLAKSISNFLEAAGLANHLELRKEQIRLSRELCASGQPFAAVSAHWDSRQHAFAVAVRSVTSPHAADTLVTATLPAGFAHPESHPAANVAHVALSYGSSVKVRTPPVIMAGQRATLFVERGPVHLSLPVVCLQSGKPRQIIRVKRIGAHSELNAEVVGSGEVRAVPDSE